MVNVAVQGCCHGELDQIYASLEYIQRVRNVKIDLLLVCGDFQSLRDNGGKDLASLACPEKYKRLGDFDQYYTGAKVAPVLTIFIGGNHESSAYLWELYHGGWVAPNIFFLGFSGCVLFKGLRIAGMSGIYKDYDYRRALYERYPFNDYSASRSIYHVREIHVKRLQLLADRPTDICLTHDWPQCVIPYGDCAQLLRCKPFFREEIEAKTLGSPAASTLLQTLKPDYHFSAHLHVKYAALYPHAGSKERTKFLALSKCLPNHEFLQVLSIPSAEEGGSTGDLQYDPDWLAIVKSTNDFLLSSPGAVPDLLSEEFRQSVRSNRAWVDKNVANLNVLPIPAKLDCRSGFLQTTQFSELLAMENYFRDLEHQDCSVNSNNVEEVDISI